MSFQYTVWAKSPSTQQEVREFNLSNLQNIPYTDQNAAAQAAATFARRMNEQRYLHTVDWEAWVKYEELGIQTFINAQNNR
jgi:hypothetical protein